MADETGFRSVIRRGSESALVSVNASAVDETVEAPNGFSITGHAEQLYFTSLKMLPYQPLVKGVEASVIKRTPLSLAVPIVLMQRPQLPPDTFGIRDVGCGFDLNVAVKLPGPLDLVAGVAAEVIEDRTTSNCP